MAKKHRISSEVKEQILKRLKEEGVSATQLADEHGISVHTIYGWLSKKVSGQPTLKELVKLKKENRILKELVGEITVKLSQTEKRG